MSVKNTAATNVASATPSADEAAFIALRTRPPLAIFSEWFAAAAAAMPQPEAMTLATVDENNCPQARTVLLKKFGEEGFVFFTNRQSRKGRALRQTPQAALLLYWPVLGRQVLIEGETTELSREQTAEYFATRPRQSQIGAWASEQSQEIESPAAFSEKVRKTEEQFASQELSLPPHWSGFCLLPRRLEFWQEGEFRLHRRLVFSRTPSAPWQSAFLQP
ncbi:MAG: pyridoxamine 5'-phosphate oxidase [Gammaproteobacteria bacterium WSBS_2016_MAG_OTU1]